MRLSDECGCRLIVFENVRGMVTARGPKGEPGEALRIIRETLFERGYRSEVRLLNAADFGVPQRRVRLFIVAYRDAARPVFPLETHAKPDATGLFLKPWRTLAKVLERTEPLAESEIIRPSGEMAKRLRGLKPGQGAKSPGKRETTRPGGHWGYLQGGFVADPDLPARTVTASSQQPRSCAEVSNDKTNSVKRVNDVLKKAGAWRRQWGMTVITGALLEGVFSEKEPRRLLDAAVELFWTHRIDLFREWIGEES